VILIFSVTGSGHFQGYACISGEGPQQQKGAADLSCILRVQWLKEDMIPFTETRHFRNKCCGNLPVHRGHGGQVMLI
jgi:hypothetical protein